MAGDLKKHEVERLAALALALGWHVEDEQYLDARVEVRLSRVFDAAVLDALGEYFKDEVF